MIALVTYSCKWKHRHRQKEDKKETPFLYLVPYTNKSIKESKGQILTIICPAEKERHTAHTQQWLHNKVPEKSGSTIAQKIRSPIKFPITSCKHSFSGHQC